jgi:hypothetical protein
MACPPAGEIAPLSSDKNPAHGKLPPAQFCHLVSMVALFSAGRDAAVPYHH